MSITTTTHLNFRGTARAALDFYRSVFGGELVTLTYADAHAVTDPAEADQVMWGQVLSPEGFHLMAFDVPAARPYDPGTDAVFVSVRGQDADAVSRYWEGLSDGAVVRAPLAPAAWSTLYGMLTDRFGVTWVMDVVAPHPG